MYHSPFHLIDPAVFEGETDAALIKRRLGLEKRKLLAEFELAGTATINLQGRELQRQDVTNLLDELQDASRLMLHLEIWEHKAFLHFLETGLTGHPGNWLDPGQDEESERLIRFVSPHYSEALNQYLRRCLQGQDDARSLLYELRADDWMLPMHVEEAYRYPTRFFTEKKNELISIRYRSENGESLLPAEIRNWCSDEQIHVLNRLPEHFDDLRYTLCERLNNLCVLYDRRQEKRKALAAIERASTIRVNDEELERLVPANLRIIRNKNSAALLRLDPDTGKKRLRILPLIIMAFVVFRLLTTGPGCFNKQSTVKPDLNRLPSMELMDLSAEEQSFRSLIRSLGKPETFTSSDTLSDSPLVVAEPLFTGSNPFEALLLKMGNRQDLLAARSKGHSVGTSYALLRNNSQARVIFLLQYAGLIQRSVYVAPGESFWVTYPNLGLSLHAYVGQGWNDTAWNSYLNHLSITYSPRQAFRGGFRTRLSVNDEDSVSGTPMFTRGDDFEATRDTFTLTREPDGSLGMYYNLGTGF